MRTYSNCAVSSLQGTGTPAVRESASMNRQVWKLRGSNSPLWQSKSGFLLLDLRIFPIM